MILCLISFDERFSPQLIVTISRMTLNRVPNDFGRRLNESIP